MELALSELCRNKEQLDNLQVPTGWETYFRSDQYFCIFDDDGENYTPKIGEVGPFLVQSCAEEWIKKCSTPTSYKIVIRKK